MSEGIRRPPEEFKLFRLGITIITALLALYLSVRLVFDPGSFTPDQVGDMTMLAGILWAVPTLLIGVRRPPPPPPIEDKMVR